MINQTFQNKNIYKDFDISFNRNPLTNDIGAKKDVEAVNQALRNLILTSYYERPFQPELGSNIRNLLFELADPITQLDIKAAIEDLINNYEPRVLLRDVRVKDYSEVNAYSISIVYEMNNVFEPVELQITLKRLR